MKDNREFIVYTIKFNDQPIYVGQSSVGYHRWVCHKTKARSPQNKNSRPIHQFMNANTVDPKTFPEFQFEILAKCTDEDIAKELEIYFQSKYEVDYHVREVKEVKELRPLVQCEELTIRGIDPDGFGFAVAKRS